MRLIDAEFEENHYASMLLNPTPDVMEQDKRNARIIIDALRMAKTVEIEPHWIPVEQDTPTEDDDYWATFEAETGRFVDWASWYQGRWVVWIDGSPAPLSNVIAWCYPIEPYKGVTT